MSKLRTAFNRFRGHPVEDDLSAYLRTVRQIREFHESAALDRMTDAEIGRLSAGLRTRFDRTGAFALAVEAARRATGLAAHDVQIVAALAMADGKIAELPTGEGKTLSAVFTAASLALSGRPVHVLTFNDYLARRDAAWMGPAYRLLGLSVGVVQEGQDKPAKRSAYACDVVYATAKEAGFDYLRDRLAYEPGELVHRPFCVALVDEADSILIDEARVPLVISGAAGAPRGRSPAPGRRSSASSSPDGTSRSTPRRANVFPTDAGIRRIEAALGVRQPLRPGERGAPGRRPLRPPRPGPPRARRRLHRPRRPRRYRRRVHRPGHGQAPLARRPAGRRRGQGGRPPRVRRPHPRLGHAAAFLPALPGALRHDGHGRALGPRAQGVLRRGRGRRPAAPALRPGRPPRRRLHPQGRQARGPGPGDRRRPRRRPARPRRHGERPGVGGARRGPRPGRRPLRGPQRQERRARSGASWPGPAPPGR